MKNTFSLAIDEAAQLVGGRKELALILGVSVAAIGNWKQRGIPFEQCMPIERATAGAVTRRNLRPDDYLTHWPELGQVNVPPAVKATKTIAQAEAAIQEAAAKIEHAVEQLSKKDAPWDGRERRGVQRANASAGQVA